MANTLTDLIPDAYAALDVVSRELVGAIPGVQRNASADRLASNQTLVSHVAPANTTASFTPSMAVPSAINQTIGHKTLTLSKNKYAGFSWTGEESNSMDQGPGFLSIQQDQIAQALRVLTNEMEADLCGALIQSSRAYGTAGTTPFASTLADSAQVRKILDDNGAPPSSRSLVIDTAAGANLRTLGQLTKANEAGGSMTLRDGELLNMHGFSIRESAQISNQVAGAMADALFSSAGAVGDTTIAFDTGTVNTTGIVAGDVITVSNHKYVVATGSTSTSGNIVIEEPGLREIVADTTAITVNATSARNVAFSSDAITLATRLPVFGNDLARDSAVITDPRTGISFEIREYPGDGMVLYRVHALWGWSVNKPEHAAILLG